MTRKVDFLRNDYLRVDNGGEKGFGLKVTLDVVLTDEDVQDLVTTALCGGIGYWAKLDNTGAEYDEAPADECIDETVARLLLEGRVVKLIDEEDGDVVDLTLDDLLTGVKMYIENGADSGLLEFDGGTVRLDMCYVDAEVADQIVQYGLFGEVVYG